MKKTFYETLWSLLEQQGILQKWFDEGLLVTRKNTTFWTPKALELLGLEESIGGLTVTQEESKKKPKEVPVEVELISLVTLFLEKFSIGNLGIAGKGGNTKAVTKKMGQFLKETDFTKQEILDAVDLYVANLKKTNSLAFCQEAHYFISKLQGGIIVSNLSKWCEEVRNNGGSKRYTSQTII